MEISYHKCVAAAGVLVLGNKTKKWEEDSVFYERLHLNAPPGRAGFFTSNGGSLEVAKSVIDC